MPAEQTKLTALRDEYLLRSRDWSRYAVTALNTGDSLAFEAAQRRAWGLERAAGAVEHRIYAIVR